MVSSRMVTTSGLSPRSTRVAMGSHQTRLHQLAQLKNLHKTEILVDQDGALPGLAPGPLGGGVGLLCLRGGDHHRLHLCWTVLAWQGLCQERGRWVKTMLQISLHFIEEFNIGFQNFKWLENNTQTREKGSTQIFIVFGINCPFKCLFFRHCAGCCWWRGPQHGSFKKTFPFSILSFALDWNPGFRFWIFRCSLAKKRSLVAQRIWNLLVAR